MERAASALEYEAAGMFRDQINALKQMQAQQFVSGGQVDIDFIALSQEQGQSCVQMVSICIEAATASELIMKYPPASFGYAESDGAIARAILMMK